MSANLFIVPHDFTSVGDAALKYALFLAKPKKTSIELLHIVSSKEKARAAFDKLTEIINNLDLQVGDVDVKAVVKTGNIFDDIGKIAESKEARLIVMGTHGATGMQKLFGSYAIKVVTSTSVPFLVVQDGTPRTKIEKIVVPIDLSKESLQIINVAGEIARTFDAEVHVLGETQSDPRLAQQIKIRISLVKKEYSEKHVNSHVHLLDGSKSYHHKVLAFAKETNADMIAMSYHSSSLFPQFDKYTQSLITNEDNIPCLIVNSKLLSKLYY
ncbi:MAG: universal stress protein [Brumimicrobium sp.]|nr:universal stress protein [Brumimicrobium sp.]